MSRFIFFIAILFKTALPDIANKRLSVYKFSIKGSATFSPKRRVSEKKLHSDPTQTALACIRKEKQNRKKRMISFEIYMKQELKKEGFRK